MSNLRYYSNSSYYLGLESKQVNFPPPSCPQIVELKNVKYQFRAEDAEFKIPNLRYIGLFSLSIVFKTEGL